MTLPIAPAKHHNSSQYSNDIRVTAVEAAADNSSVAATVVLDQTRLSATKTVKVHVGDVVVTKDGMGREEGNEVISIVPSDAALQLIGWVEFDTEKLSAADVQDKKYQGHLIRRLEPR